ncbi:MAG: DUF4091 domain-containing protein [Acidobacteria bacterium]|nr:DUF4091 domain-containing protein [Acidobacteriota bacterium]
MGNRLRAILLLTLLGQAASAAAPQVWVIGEGFRVDPLTGRVREEQRTDGNPLPAAFDYTQHNLAWDSAARRIRLAAARNELVAYQLQVRGPARNVKVIHGDLQGPGLIRSSVDVEIFQQWYLNVKVNSSNKYSATAGYNLGKGWYADALIPMNATAAFDIPDQNNAIPGQQWQGVWVDIYTVYPATLSDDYAVEVGLNNYGGIGRKGSEMRLRYYQMARRHRMAIHEHYIAPRLEGGTPVWKEYDAEMGKYFTGEAFTSRHGYRGPGEGKPLRWAYLPFEILKMHAWPLPGSAAHTPEYDATVRRLLKGFAGHFQDQGWTATSLMFFINGLDEPTKAEVLENIRYFGELARSVNAPGVYYRSDINHLHDIQNMIPGWTEQRMLNKLSPVVNLWCSVADFQRTDFSVLLDLKKQDPKQVVWFYQNREPSVGGYTLDDETIGLATWPVIAWKYGIDGAILWECCFAGPSRNLWVDPNNTVDRGKGLTHNLAGQVIYPAYPGKTGITEPVAGIRLKSFRRGAQDYEYLRLLARSAGREEAMKRLSRVLGDSLHRPNRPYGAPGNWSHNPEEWNLWRLEVLKTLR